MMDFIPIKDFWTLQQWEQIFGFLKKIQTFCSTNSQNFLYLQSSLILIDVKVVK